MIDIPLGCQQGINAVVSCHPRRFALRNNLHEANPERIAIIQPSVVPQRGTTLGNRPKNNSTLKRLNHACT
jgi:hypothetical protein